MRDDRNEIIRRKRHKRFLLQQEKEAGKRQRIGSAQSRARRDRDELWPRSRVPKLIKKGLAVVRVPETFSFIENPIDAVSTIDDLHAAISDATVREIFIDFSKCQTLDLCASSVMTTMVLRATRTRHRKRKSFELKGNYPAGEKARILLRGSGLLKYIRSNAPVLPLDVQAKLLVMELRSGYSKRPERSAKCDQATTALVTYVNSCLAKSGAMLTAFGNQWLATLIGETIANAEEHSEGPWHATAHFDRLDPNTEGGSCHIVLMNFGATIADSFSRPDSDAERLKRLKALANRHRERHFFDLRKRSYNEETLFTLYALQEGVTRTTGARRGIGTTLLIEFFRKLSAPQAKMCVVSGTAFVLFDGTYSLTPIDFEGAKKRVIAFNKENSLEERPDDDYVWALPEPFPGTLISLRFNLKKDYVVAETEAETQVTVCPIESQSISA